MRTGKKDLNEPRYEGNHILGSPCFKENEGATNCFQAEKDLTVPAPCYFPYRLVFVYIDHRRRCYHPHRNCAASLRCR